MSYLPDGVISFFCRHYKDTILAVGLSSISGCFFLDFPLAKAEFPNIKANASICEGECVFEADFEADFGAELQAGAVGQSDSQLFVFKVFMQQEI